MRTETKERSTSRCVGAAASQRLVAAFTALTLLASIALVGLDSTPASAHTPHDVVASVAVSPAFSKDRTAYTIVRQYLLKSTDGGGSWSRLNKGLDNKFSLSSVVVSRQDPNLLFAASRGDGVYKSTDAGASWTAVDLGLQGHSDILYLFASPVDDQIVYAVTHDGQVFSTSDAGASWAPAMGLTGNDVTSMAFGPEGTKDVFAGAHGVLMSSSDGGDTWEKQSVSGEDHLTAIALSPDFAKDRTMLIGTATKGVLVSTDSGKSFSDANTGIKDKRIQGLQVSSLPTGGSVALVSTWTDGVYRSTDMAKNWKRTSKGLTTNEQADLLKVPQFRALTASDLIVDKQQTIFVAGFDGLFRSTDDGKSWHEVTTQDSDNIAALAVSPDYERDRTVAVGTYINGAKRSTDGGESWTAINKGLAFSYDYLREDDYYARLTSLEISPTYPKDHTLLAGSRGYLFRSTNKGDEWTPTVAADLVTPVDFPPDHLVPNFSPNFAKDRTIFAGTNSGFVFRWKMGQTPRRIATIGKEIIAIQASPDYPTHDAFIAATVDGVYLGSDGAKTWKKVPNTPKDLLGLAVPSGFAKDHTAFIGSKNGLLVTKDGGRVWNYVKGQPFGDRAYIEAIVASPDFSQDRTLLVSVRGLGLFRSTDGGETFAAVGQDLLDRNVVLASFYHPTGAPIVFSPNFARDRTVFGIAQAGLYRSTDAGDTWKALTIPKVTHPTTKASAPNALLSIPRVQDLKTVAPDGKGGLTATAQLSGEHTVLVLSTKRVLAAVAAALIALAALWLVKFGSRSSTKRLAIYVRVACSGLVFAIALFFLTNR